MLQEYNLLYDTEMFPQEQVRTNAPFVVAGNRVNTGEWMNDFYTISATGLYPVDINDDISNTPQNFKCDYDKGICFFNPAMEGQTVYLSYHAKGKVMIDSSRVKIDDTDLYYKGDSLEDVIKQIGDDFQKASETVRIEHEDQRIANENTRISNENYRIQHELDRDADYAQIKADYNTASNFNVMTYRMWTFTATSDNTTTFQLAVGIFNPILDIPILVYRNCVLAEGVDYTRVGAQITLNNAINTNEKIIVMVFKGLINEPIQADGSNIMNGSLTQLKLSTDIQASLNSIGNLTAQGITETTLAEAIKNNKTKINDLIYKTNNIYHSKEFGVVADGIANDTTTLQTAINSTPNGSTLTISGNVTLFGSVYITDKNINIVFEDNATITKKTTNPTFIIKGGFQTTKTVSSIINVSNKSVLTVNDASGLKKGDTIRIVSDDTYPLTNRRYSISLAEYGIISSISGNSITLTSTLVNTYSTNIRIAKLNNYSPTIKGGTWIGTGYVGAMIQVRGTKNARLINLHCSSADSEFIQIRGAYGLKIENLCIDYLTDDEANGYYGYAINDISGYACRITGGNIQNVRHGYTTNSGKTSEIVDLCDYGEPMFETLDNCVVIGANGTAFDSHENGKYLTISNCQAINCFANAFSFRSDTISLLNCKAISCAGGYAITDFSNTHAAKNIRIVDCYADVYGYALYGTGVSGNYITGIEVEGGEFISRTSHPVDFDCCATIRMKNVTVGSKSSSEGVIIALTDSKLDAENITCTSVLTSGTVYVSQLDTNSELYIDGVNIIYGTTTVTSYLANFLNVVDINSNPQNSNKATILNVKMYGTTHPDMFYGKTYALEYWGTYKSKTDYKSSAYKYIAPASGATLTLDIQGIADKHILAHITHTGVTFNVFPAGFFGGQLLTIRNNSATTALTLDASNLATSRMKVTSGTVAANTKVLFVYNSSGYWDELSRSTA